MAPEKKSFEITLATQITFLRILCVPFIIHSMMHEEWITATWLFIFASLTDVLDGMVARMRQETSLLGTLLDPVADKLLLLSVYAGLMLGHMHGPSIPLWFVLLALVHELMLAAGTVYFGLYKQQVVVAPSRLAKLVGVAQFLFIFWTLWCGFLEVPSSPLFYQLIILIAIARTCVLVQYGLQLTRRNYL